jgi:hypothetical protein
MSKHEKLLHRFLTGPKDFTLDELRTLLHKFGYRECSGGKTSGSRIAFIHQHSKHIIRIHKPHPQNTLKSYQMSLVREELKSRGMI